MAWCQGDLERFGQSREDAHDKDHWRLKWLTQTYIHMCVVTEATGFQKLAEDFLSGVLAGSRTFINIGAKLQTHYPTITTNVIPQSLVHVGVVTSGHEVLLQSQTLPTLSLHYSVINMLCRQ